MNTNSTVTFAEVRSTGNIIAYYSDDRLKDRRGTIENALDKINALEGFYFKQNDTANELIPMYKDVMQVGVSAQEVQKVLPEAIVDAPIDSQYLSVQYDKLIPLLVQAIKELEKKLEAK